MMDDLASPIESALIVYDRFEDGLRRPTMRWLAPLLGVLLLADAAVLLWQYLPQTAPGGTQGDGPPLTATVLGLTGAVLGAGLMARQTWALLASYVLVLIQALSSLLLGDALTGAVARNELAWMLLGSSSVLLMGASALVATAPSRHPEVPEDGYAEALGED